MRKRVQKPMRKHVQNPMRIHVQNPMRMQNTMRKHMRHKHKQLTHLQLKHKRTQQRMSMQRKLQHKHMQQRMSMQRAHGRICTKQRQRRACTNKVYIAYVPNMAATASSFEHNVPVNGITLSTLD